MSTYQIDDATVSYLLGNLDLLPPKLAVQLEGLRVQLPVPEPDRDYIVLDREGDLWRWSVRQSAWECTRNPAAYLGWQSLVEAYGPLRVYGEIR